MHKEFDPASAGEISKSLELQPGAGEAQLSRSQLSQPNDISAARNYFQQAAGSQSALPDLQFDTTAQAPKAFDLQSFTGGPAPGAGSEAVGAKTIAGMAKTAGLESVLPGAEHGLQSLMPGLEQGLLPGVPPGAEPISPAIQMILKMPGLTGIVGSFFEALLSFLFPADGGLLNLFNPTFWAEAAQQAVGNFMMLIGNNIPLTFSIFGANNPMLHTVFQNGLMDMGKTFSAANPVSISFEHQPFDAYQAMNVGGMANGKALYEMAPIDASNYANGINVSVDPNRFIAMEGGNSFGPSLGGGQVPTATMTQQPVSNLSTQTYSAPPAAQAPAAQTSAPGGYFSRNHHFESGPVVNDQGALGGDRGSLLDQSAQPQDGTIPDGTDVAANPPVPENYTVQHGDNLWNIAKERLGSGTRWTEIYELNKNIIGDNPDLIFSGTDLKLPGMENVAGGTHDYVVKSGDNLWNIARDHLGGGKNWHAIYDQNASVIGSNPDLIHPGQHFAIPDGGGNAHLQVAQGSSGPLNHATSPTTHPSPTTHLSHSNGHTNVSHHAPSHHSSPHGGHHTPDVAHGGQHGVPHGGNKIAHAAASHARSVMPKDAPGTTGDTISTATAAPNEVAGLQEALAKPVPETIELGKTAHVPVESMKQEIGLKAVAKSL